LRISFSLGLASSTTGERWREEARAYKSRIAGRDIPQRLAGRELIYRFWKAFDGDNFPASAIGAKTVHDLLCAFRRTVQAPQ